VLDKLIIDISVDEEKAPTTAEVEISLWKKSAKSFVYTKHRQRCGGEGSVITREVKRVSSLVDELFASAIGLCKGVWMETGPKRGGTKKDKRMNGLQWASKNSRDEVERRWVHSTSPHCSYMAEYAAPLNTEKTSSAAFV
jgi:hypothetical protein